MLCKTLIKEGDACLYITTYTIYWISFRRLPLIIKDLTTLQVITVKIRH